MSTEQKIFRYYPYPIALTFKNLVGLSNSDDTIELKHNTIGYLIEVIIKYLAAIVISEYSMEKLKSKDIDKLLSNVILRSSILDQWNSILKKILKLYREHDKKHLVSELAGAYFDKKKEDYAHITKAYKELRSILKEEGRDVTQISLNDFIPRLLKYHFTFWESKYAKLTKKQLKERVMLLEPAIEEILLSLSFLGSYKLVYVFSEDDSGVQKQYDIQIYMGAAPKEHIVQSIRSSKELELNRLYLCSYNKLIPALDLYPFFVMEYCGDCKTGQIFALKDNENGVLRYFSSHCGHGFTPFNYLKDFKCQFGMAEDELDEEEISGKIKDIKSKEDVILPQQSTSIYEMMIEMSLIDGPLSHEEIEKLELIRNKFNIKQEKARQIFKSVETRVFEVISEVKEGYLEQIRLSTDVTLRDLVYKQYPYPIAHSYWQLNYQSSGELRTLLLRICSLLEIIIKFFSSIVVSQYIRDSIDDVNVNLHLEKLVEPGLEEWLVFLEDILKLYNKKDEKLIIGELYNFYFSKRPEWNSGLKAYKAISENEFFLFKGDTELEELSIAEFFKLVPDFVETVMNFEEELSINQIKEFINMFVPVIDDIMSNLKFLIAYKLFYVKKAAYQKGKVRHEIIDCMGAMSLDETEYFDDTLYTQEKVYLSSSVDKSFPVLNLSPFWFIKDYPSVLMNQLFFFSRVTGDGSLEYSNYNGEDNFTSQDNSKDLIKAFRKFTSEKKVNLVIKLLDWQKEKRKKDLKKSNRSLSIRRGVTEESKKIHEDAKKASENKKQSRNTYRYALETAWSDGILSDDERVYLDELSRILSLSSSDIKLIEDSTRAKFAEKIDRIVPKDQDELLQNLAFLEEEHQLLLKTLEERRQKIKNLEKKLKTFENERDILIDNAEKFEAEMLEKDRESSKLKKLVKEFKIKLDSAGKQVEQGEALKDIRDNLEKLQKEKEQGDKENQELKEELLSSSKELSKLQSEISQSRKKNSLLEENIKKLQYKLKQVHSGNLSHMEALKTLEADKETEIGILNNELSDSKNRNIELEKEIKTLSKNNSSLVKVVQDLTKKVEEGKKVLLRVRELEEISEKLKESEEYSEKQSNELSEIKKQLTDLMKNKNELEKNLVAVNKNKDALLKVVQMLKSKLDDSKKILARVKDFDNIKSRLEEVEQQNKELLNMKETRESEYINLVHDLDRINSEAVHMKARLEEAEQQNRSLMEIKEAREAEYMNLVQELDRVSSETLSIRKDFHSSKDERETLLKLVNDLREKLVQSDKITDDLQNKIEWYEKEKIELSNSNEKQSQKIKQLFDDKKILQTNIAELNKEKISLEAKFEKLLKEFASTKQFIIQNKNKVLEYETLELELNKLRAEQDDYLAERKVFEEEKTELELKISELEKQKEALELMKETFEEQLMSSEEKLVQTKYVADEHDKLVQKMREIEREKQELIRNNEKQKNTIIDLIKKTSSLTEEHKKLTMEIQSLEMEKDEILSFNQELKERQKIAESGLASVDKEVLEIKENNLKLTRDVELKVVKIQEMKEEIEKVKELGGGFERLSKEREKEIQILKENNSRLMQALEGKKLNIQELEVKFKEFTENIERLTQEKQKYEIEINKVNSELASARLKIDELAISMSEVPSIPPDFISEKEGLLSQIETQKDELKKLKQDISKREEELNSLENDRANYQKERSKLLMLLKSLKGKLSERNKEIEEIQNKVMPGFTPDDNLKKKIKKLEAEKIELETLNLELKKEKDGIIDKLEKELCNLNTVLEDKKTELDLTTSTRDNELKKLAEVETEKNKLEVLNADLIKEKDRIVSELEGEVRNLKVTLEDKNSEIDRLTKVKLYELEIKIDKLEIEKAEFEVMTLDLKREKERIVSELEGELSNLRSLLEDKKIELINLEGSIKREPHEVDKLVLEKNALEKSWSDLKQAEEQNLQELQEEWAKLAEGKELLEIEKSSLARDKELIKTIDIDTLEAEKRELESAWLELSEEREKLNALSEELEEQRLSVVKDAASTSQSDSQIKEVRLELDKEWQRLEEEKRKLEDEQKVLEQERILLQEEHNKILKSEAAFYEKDDIPPICHDRDTLILNKHEVEEYMLKNLPQ